MVSSLSPLQLSLLRTLRRQIALALWPQCAAEVFASRCRVVVKVSRDGALISFGTACGR